MLKKLYRIIRFPSNSLEIITKNTAWLTISEIISRLLKFLLIIYATRALGPIDFGKFSFALSMVALFVVLADFGLPIILSREVSQGKEEVDDFSSVLTLKTGLGLLAFLSMFMIGVFTTHDITTQRIIIVLALYGFFDSTLQIFFAYLQAKELLEYEAWANILQALITAIVGILLISIFSGPLPLAYAYLLGSLLILAIVSLGFFPKIKRYRIGFQKIVWKNYILMAWPLAFTGIFSAIYNNIDTLMLGYWGQIREVGIYSAMYRIVWMLMIPSIILARAFFPSLNKHLAKMKKIYFWVTISIGSALTVIGFVLTPALIKVIYGKNYVSGVFSLRVLMFTVILGMLIAYYTQVLTIRYRQRVIFYSTMIGASINIMLNFLLIPIYSLNGAAIATLISILITLFIQVYFESQETRERDI